MFRAKDSQTKAKVSHATQEYQAGCTKTTKKSIPNWKRLQDGFPLTIILKNDQKKYHPVLTQADQNKLKPLALFIAQAMECTLDIYLKTLTPVTSKREQYLPLSKLAKSTPYSAKYLNLLIRQGKLAAHKDGRL